ncbi:MAG: hypothetical protein WBX15_03790 [Thermoanaerobaculia bacterium]
MRITTARVVNGRLNVDAEALPEGQLVKVALLEEEPVTLTDEEKVWLREAVAAASEGGATDARAFLDELEARE